MVSFMIRAMYVIALAGVLMLPFLILAESVVARIM